MKHLYKLTTAGCGEFWVIATDPTAAQEKLTTMLNNEDYGNSRERPVTQIEVLAIERTSENWERLIL